MEDYDPIASYYSYMARRTDYALWFAYLRDISGIADMKGKSILDLGCGAGQLLSFFYAGGAFCQGVDTSSEMLSRCDMKLYETRSRGGSYELVKNDMVLFSPRGKRTFDFAYSACDSINYLDRQGLGSLLASMKTYMAPGSVFTFDIINPKGDFPQREVIRRPAGDIILERSREEGLFITKITCEGTQQSLLQHLFGEDDIASVCEADGVTAEGIYDFLTGERRDLSCDKLQVLVRF